MWKYKEMALTLCYSEEMAQCPSMALFWLEPVFLPLIYISPLTLWPSQAGVENFPGETCKLTSFFV